LPVLEVFEDAEVQPERIGAHGNVAGERIAKNKDK
jgi:hypothetical protein